MTELLKGLDYSAVLRDFQYKPNFAFAAYKREKDMWWIKAVMAVEDARKPWEQWELKPARQDRHYDDFFLDFDRNRYIPGPSFAGYSPSREVVYVEGNYPIPYFDVGDEKMFLEWLVRTVRAMEDHEMYEWLRYKGELINDPHKED